MNLEKNITIFRKKQKLSQERLAELVGVSRQTISNWEVGETMPTAKQITLLAEIFQITTDELLGVNPTNTLIKRMQGTEKLVKKQLKFIKIIFITIYFLILFILIGFIIYFFTLKDFTSDYQETVYCNIKDRHFRLMITPGEYNKYDEETKEYLVINDSIWRLHIEETDKLGKIVQNDIGLSAGYSYKYALDSLNMIKKRIIEKGGTCK